MHRATKTLVFGLALAVLLWSAPAPAGDRFKNNGDGTVTDHEMGLMWAGESNRGDVEWKQAERYCKFTVSSILAGGKYNDWRLPTIAELQSLYTGKESDPGYETDCGQIVRIVPDIQISCGWVWSSEEKSITARVFNFHRGYSYTDRKVHFKNYRALPVRDLKPGE